MRRLAWIPPKERRMVKRRSFEAMFSINRDFSLNTGVPSPLACAITKCLSVMVCMGILRTNFRA